MATNGFTRRQFLRLSATTGAGLVVAACGGTPTAPSTGTSATSAAAVSGATAPDAVAPTAASEIPATAPGTIALWGWWDVRMQIYQNAADDFAKENANTTVKVENFPGDNDMVQKIYAAVAAGTGPTLLKMGEFLFDMRDQDLIVPYPETAFPDSWFAETFPNFDANAYGRSVVPTGVSPIIMVYNKRMFTEVGLDPEKPPRTWDELIDAAKKLTQTDGSGAITRAGFVPSNEFTELDYIYQQGGNVVRTEGDRQVSTFKTPEVERAFQFIADLALTHKVWSPELPSFLEAMGTGTAAITIGEAYIIGEFKSNYPELFADLAFTVPATPTGEAAPYYGRKSQVLDLSVVKGHDDQVEPAFGYLEYLYKQRPDIAKELVNLIGIAPEHAALFEDPAFKDDPITQTLLTVAVKEYDPIQPKAELDDILSDARTRIIQGGEPIATVLEEADQEWQTILDGGLAKYIR